MRSRLMSRVLYPPEWASVIHLDLLSPTGSSSLPLDIGRAALNTPCGM